MNAWSLAIGNLSTIEPDTRQKCAWCGDMFEPYQATRTIYCCNDCKEQGSKQRKRESAARRRGAGKTNKPLEQCVPNWQHTIERKRYWKEVFGNVTS